jgi:Metal-dependent hydrolase involved in phosphonate metabolism
LQAAEAAKKNNNGVIMGAPNIMRGGSQAGNIDAIKLVKSDLVDCLVSDYYYPALLESVWKMADMKVRSFENSYKMISTNPARLLNLADRGELVDNARADLLILNPDNRKIVAVFCRGIPFFVSDELVGSLSAA